MGLPAITAAAPPPLVEWDWSAASNSTLSVGGSSLLLSQGTLLWASAERACRAASSAAPPVASTSTFYALPALMPADHAARLVERLRPARFDLRADSVDNLPAHEFYILTSGEPARSATPPLAAEEEEEVRLRTRLARELAPTLARLRAAANAQFGSICGGGCRPCTALVRRYRAAERRSHPEHVDAEAAVTAVVGLTSAREDFDGGLFVSDTARRLFVPLRAGDALLHSADLFHGVHVRGGGERWSLVVWFRTCDKCSMSGADGWFAARAAQGEPIAQYLLGRRLAQEHSGGAATGALGGRSARQTRERRSRGAQWLHAAASAGFAPAMHMLGRASLGRGEVREAVAWLRRSVECFSYETDFGRPPIAMRAAHDLARILLKCAEFGWPRPYEQLDGSVLTDGDQQAQGLQLLRRAAVAGHRVAAKALSEAYADGRWGVSPDPRLAEGWLACANEADMEGHACSDMASECHVAANAPQLMISIEPTAATSTESSSAHRVAS